MKLLFQTFIVLLTLFFISETYAQPSLAKQYIDSFKGVAMIEMIEYKIPASITLSQGILESGLGNSRLAKQGNNHFGIKCKKDWTGCTILEDDDALQECFRCYGNPRESYKDHSLFLVNGKRYASLFQLNILDYEGWSKGLLAAGYATNQKYADLLISTIEKYQLAKFDTLVSNGFNPYNFEQMPNIEVVNNKVPYKIIQPNETIETIAESVHKSERKLKKYNDLENRIIAPGDVLYLKPKKRKASIESHKVEIGENMWLISQKFGVKLNVLYKKNKMEDGTEALPGQTLNLRSKTEQMPDTGRVNLKNIQTTEHKVKQGETIYAISKLYNMTVLELKVLNNLESESLYINQTLKVKATYSDLKLEHIVQQGETLYSISKKYNVSVDEIKNWNNFQDNVIKMGQIIVTIQK